MGCHINSHVCKTRGVNIDSSDIVYVKYFFFWQYSVYNAKTRLLVTPNIIR